MNIKRESGFVQPTQSEARIEFEKAMIRQKKIKKALKAADTNIICEVFRQDGKISLDIGEGIIEISLENAWNILKD